MHGNRERLDPGACGIRFGVYLRARAEAAARLAGMPLSVWVRRLVQERLGENEIAHTGTSEKQPDPNRELDAAFAAEMEKLK